MRVRSVVVVGVALSVAPFVGCKEGPPKLTGPATNTSASADPDNVVPKTPKPNVTPAPPPETFPLTDSQLAQILNPSGATEYTGPTGVVEGTITIKGDPPAMRGFMTLPKGCEAAVPIHAPAYRAGPKGELADTLVAVIGYSGYVRPSRDDKHITIKNCSVEPTVIDLSLGQRLLVSNADPMPYTPQIAQKMLVRRLAIQGMTPVPINITEPGAWGFTWLAGALPGTDVPTATIFVLPNALHTVTGLDGKFRLTGIPVGKARVTASHLHMPEAFKDIEIQAGKEHKVDLVLTYKSPVAPASAAPTSSVKLPPGMDKPLH